MSEPTFTPQEKQKLLNENAQLQARLEQVEQKLETSEQQRQESEDIIEAIRTGSVDALTIGGEEGPQIFTLQSADHTYRILIEEMNEGALTLNEEAMILYSNARFATFVHLPLERVIGSSFYTFLPEQDHPRFTTLFHQGWQNKGKGEFVMESAEGKRLPFSISMNALPGSTPPAIGMIVTDLSAEKEIQTVRSQVEMQNLIISSKEVQLQKAKQAREEAERFRLVLESIPQMAWTSLPSGAFNFYNKRWYAYTGLKDEPSKDQGWLQVVHPHDLPATQAAYTHAIKTGEPFVLENRYKRGSDGTYRWHSSRALPLQSEQGQILLWVGTATDVHEQKLAEQANQKLSEELAATNEELSAANEEIQATNEELSQANGQLVRTNVDLNRANIDLDNFIYTASHDLKAPISNIEALLSALLRTLPVESLSSERTGRLTSLMQESIERFKRTIANLTEVVKLQKENNGEMVFVELLQVIEEVLLDLEPLITETKAKLKIDVTSCPKVRFSEKNLRSVVYNLLSNALKYRSFDRMPQVEISCEQTIDYHLLIIVDNGLGMENSRLNQMFTMFKRFHDHVEGSGIGLYMVKKMVENAGGKIEVESSLNIGSTFRVYFPH